MVAWLRTTPPLGRAPPLRTPEAQLIDCPLVLVAGNMGDATHAAAELSARGLHVVCPPLGPVSSCHDRACELFYALKGGRVDYGAAHSAAHGHRRFGAIAAAGLHPGWSAARPVLLLTHSQGGLAARALLRLLAAGGFEGHDTSAGWVRGVVAISAPFNGAPLIDHPGFGGVPLPTLRPARGTTATPQRDTLATQPSTKAPTAAASSRAAAGTRPLAPAGTAVTAPTVPTLPTAVRGSVAVRAYMPHAQLDSCRLDERGEATRPPLSAYMPHHFLFASPRPGQQPAGRQQPSSDSNDHDSSDARGHGDAQTAALPRRRLTPLSDRTALEGAAAASELEQPVGHRVVSVLITLGYVADILVGWCAPFRDCVWDWRVAQWGLTSSDLLPLLRWRHLLQVR